MENVPAGTKRTEISEEPPQGMERRLVLRLLAHWRSICDDDSFPSFTRIVPDHIPDMWPSSFVLEVMEAPEDPIFRAVGAEIASYSETSLVGRRVSDVEKATVPEFAVAYFDEVLTKRVPISRGGEFFKADGTKVLYRSILLPMSDDGETVSGLLGAANCREVRED